MVRPETQDQWVYLLLGIVIYISIWNQVVIISVRMFTSVLKERISYEPVTQHFFTIDPLQETANQLEDFKFSF